MSVFVSCNSYDCHKCTIVPVIAAFDTDGQILPLYIRIEGVSYKICSHTLKSSLVLKTYQINIADNGFYKPLELTFHPSESVWTIPI